MLRLRIAPWFTVLVGVVVLAACTSDEPSASATPIATPSVAFTEVGDGTVLEAEWTYGVGRDENEWCTRFEVAGRETSRCGGLLPEDEDAFGEVGRGPAEYEEAHVVDGFVTDEALTVWLVGDGGQYRIPAVMMPLDDVGIEGAQAYVGFARADVTLTHLQAVALNGDVLQTYELP